MIKKLIWNDMRQNKLFSAVTIFFMAISAMVLVITVFLFSNLLSSINALMDRAKVPDFMQMHTGELDTEEILSFAKDHKEIKQWQIYRFLNLENSQIVLGDHSLADSTQDNGLSLQGEGFDYLLDMENNIPSVLPGEVYVPVCYRSRYDLEVGDKMEIGSQMLVIGGFIRDAQMNSMMASSKRFLVNEVDYNNIQKVGKEEYLIEFILEKGADINDVSAAYGEEGLPANGPSITKSLIRFMNALSDGMMILVIFLVSIVILLISMLCIHFILSLRMEKDRKEIGMLKALGISKREIRRLYLKKYILFSFCGAAAGFLAAFLVQKPLVKQIQELYGMGGDRWLTWTLSIFTLLITEGIILLAIRHFLRKFDQFSPLEALNPVQEKEKKSSRKQYWLIGFVMAACAFLMLVPQNLYHTISSPGFVTYMGIGDGEIRMDVRQGDKIFSTTNRIASQLEQDTQVEKYTVLRTKSCRAYLSDGRSLNVNVEMGDHSIFPVSYSKGKFPERNTELALSAFYAKELNLDVGDTLKLLTDGKEIDYRVCGIYSDITNGGKTAKAGGKDFEKEEDDSTVWSVLYVSLKENVSKEAWINQYRQYGGDVTDIADYVKETFGPMLEQIHLASRAAAGISVLVIFAVITLFMRLIVERNRYSISLQKALGFTEKGLKRTYTAKGLFPVVTGTAAGLFFGNLCGEGICGLVLKSFGADEFQFVIAWEWALIFIPALFLLTAGVAVRAGIWEIKKVKTYECCMGKE